MTKEFPYPDMPEFLIHDAKARHEARQQMKQSPEKTLAPAAEAATAEGTKRAKKPAAAAKGSNGHAKNTKGLKAAPKPKPKAKAAAKGKAKVTRQQDPAKLDEYGLRKGSMKSKAAAMYASKKGATLAEVEAKLESTQFNVLTQLAAKGYKVKQVKEKGDGNRTVKRYFLTG